MQCCKPSLQAIKLYEKRHYKTIALPQKNLRGTLAQFFKNKESDCQLFMDG